MAPKKRRAEVLSAEDSDKGFGVDRSDPNWTPKTKGKNGRAHKKSTTTHEKQGKDHRTAETEGQGLSKPKFDLRPMNTFVRVLRSEFRHLEATDTQRAELIRGWVSKWYDLYSHSFWPEEATRPTRDYVESKANSVHLAIDSEEDWQKAHAQYRLLVNCLFAVNAADALMGMAKTQLQAGGALAGSTAGISDGHGTPSNPTDLGTHEPIPVPSPNPAVPMASQEVAIPAAPAPSHAPAEPNASQAVVIPAAPAPSRAPAKPNASQAVVIAAAQPPSPDLPAPIASQGVVMYAYIPAFGQHTTTYATAQAGAANPPMYAYVPAAGQHTTTYATAQAGAANPPMYAYVPAAGQHTTTYATAQAGAANPPMYAYAPAASQPTNSLATAQAESNDPAMYAYIPAFGQHTTTYATAQAGAGIPVMYAATPAAGQRINTYATAQAGANDPAMYASIPAFGQNTSTPAGIPIMYLPASVLRMALRWLVLDAW